MGLKEILSSFKRRWWLIVLLIVLGCAAGFASTTITKPMYKAQTSVCVMQNNVNQASNSLIQEDIALGQLLLQQYSEIISSQTVTSAILNDVKNYNISDIELKSMIKTVKSQDSVIFLISATGPDPAAAAAVANATAKEFIYYIASLTNYKNMGILDPAVIPNNPVEGKVRLSFLGALLGLMIALSLIFIIEYFNITIRSAEDIENELNLQVIGIIPDNNIR